MDIGLGLPTAVPGLDRDGLLDWAGRGERTGFSSVAVIDRLVWGNWSALGVLAAVAAVTERVGLVTSILLAPLRGPGVLVKDLATIDALAGPGRLRVGLAVGSRDDDYEAAGVPFTRRGRLLDAELEALRQWRAGAAPLGIGPVPVSPGGPPVLVGGGSEAAMRRVASVDGWVAGGGGPGMFSAGAARVQTAWATAGREGKPYLMALAYVSLLGGTDAAQAVLGSYYGFAGPLASRVVEGSPTDQAALRSMVEAFAQAGCDELLLFPCTVDPAEIELMAEAVGFSERPG